MKSSSLWGQLVSEYKQGIQYNFKKTNIYRYVAPLLCLISAFYLLHKFRNIGGNMW